MGRATQVAALLDTLAGEDPEVVRRALNEFAAKDQTAALAAREGGNGGSLPDDTDADPGAILALDPDKEAAWLPTFTSQTVTIHAADFAGSWNPTGGAGGDPAGEAATALTLDADTDRLIGILVEVVTPFQPDGTHDVDALIQLKFGTAEWGDWASEERYAYVDTAGTPDLSNLTAPGGDEKIPALVAHGAVSVYLGYDNAGGFTGAPSQGEARLTFITQSRGQALTTLALVSAPGDAATLLNLRVGDGTSTALNFYNESISAGVALADITIDDNGQFNFFGGVVPDYAGDDVACVGNFDFDGGTWLRTTALDVILALPLNNGPGVVFGSLVALADDGELSNGQSSLAFSDADGLKIKHKTSGGVVKTLTIPWD